jgi:hypothetical protein
LKQDRVQRGPGRVDLKQALHERTEAVGPRQAHGHDFVVPEAEPPQLKSAQGRADGDDSGGNRG